MVHLYKYVDGKWRLVDYGVDSKSDTYVALGYLVRKTNIKVTRR